MDIRFRMPVDIIMQEECVLQNRSVISAYGSRAAVVLDSQGMGSGALKDITAALHEGHTAFSTSAVEGYLTSAEIHAFDEKNRQFGAEMVISVGGELAVNAGKALSLLAAQQGGDFAGGQFRSASLPHIVIPTTAAAGNELTPYMAFRGASGELRTLTDPALFPRCALLDYRYTAAIPWEATVNAAFSAIGCAVEVILSAESSKFVRAIAWESLTNTSAVLLALEEDLVDIGIRRMMMYDSVLAGIASGQAQASGLRGISQLLTRDRGIPQGKAAGLLLVPYLHFIWRQKPHLADMILRSMGFQSLDNLGKKTAPLLSNKDVFSASEIQRWAAEAAALPDVKNCIAVLSEKDISQILQMI